MTPPIWLDAAGRPRPTRACWTCGREVTPMRFRAEHLRPHGWAPSEGLAPLVVDHLAEQIARLKREGLTILLAEQTVDFCLELADRVYVLEKGHIRYDGTAGEFRADESIRHQYLAL